MKMTDLDGHADPVPSNLDIWLDSAPNLDCEFLPESVQQDEANNTTLVFNNSNNVTLNSSLISSSFILSENKMQSYLNFKEILELFGCAISQEQAWAVLNQCLIELKFLMDTNIELLYLNQDCIEINILNFVKDGSILFDFSVKQQHIKDASKPQTLTPNKIMQMYEEKRTCWPSDQMPSSATNCGEMVEERVALEAALLKSVAYLIFDALDYGNSQQNEPDLNNTLQNLLVQMSGFYRQFTGSARVSEDDEGYEQEDEEVAMTVEKSLEICKTNVPEADYHYKAVCRGLYAQAYELKAFLAKIEDSKKILKKSGKEPSADSFEILNRTDWAKLWMQVIHELRNGVKLRKVSDNYIIGRRHIEFELTPFEILLDQIRAKRYNLKKPGPSLQAEAKKDARDIILEFIRSRPPLKKSTQRKLKPRQIKLNQHDQLMISIRTFAKPLKKVPEKDTTIEETTDANGETKTVAKKRLLKVDKKLLRDKYSSSDEDDSDIDYDELQNSSIFFQSDQYLFQSGYAPNLTDSLINASQSQQQKKSIKAPESLKSPLSEWSEPVEDWRALVTEDILAESKNRFEGGRSPLERRHTMNLADTISTNLASLNLFGSEQKSKLSEQKQKVSELLSECSNYILTRIDHQNVRPGENSFEWPVLSNEGTECDSDCNKAVRSPEYMKSGPGQVDFCYIAMDELIEKITSVDISLTFSELCHIRKVLTKNDLDYLLFDKQLYQEVSKGRVCFSCRKTRFNLFHWGCKCNICEQRICRKCLKRVVLNNGQLAQVPLAKLCPRKFSDAINDKSDAESRNSNSSICSQSTNNEEDSDQMTSSNEKLEVISTTSSIYAKLNASSQLLNICVDCYQLTVSVKVNNSDDDEFSDSSDTRLNKSSENIQSIHPTMNYPTESRYKSINHDLVKFLHKQTNSPSCLKSPETPTMNSLSHIKNGHNNSSPLVNSYQIGHHSTPTPKPIQILDTTDSNENDLSDMLSRNDLTLDLNY